jgi:cytochrome c-type biogenesis protein CcmH
VTALAFVVVFAGIASLAYFGLLPGQRLRDGTERVLRDLLQDREDGRIDEEEFLSRQASLYAKVMAERNSASRDPHVFARWAIPLGVIAVTAGVVAVAGVYYARLGSPEVRDIEPAALVAAPVAPPGGASPASGGDMHAMVRRLAEKMEKDASNGQGWLLLARAYAELRQYRDAASAYAKAAALLPPESGMLANWADALVLANGRQWDDESGGIVQRALAADPNNLKALALAGTEAFERGRYEEAIAFWKRMQVAAPADSMDAKLAEANIREANERIVGAKVARALPGSVAVPNAAPARSVTGGAATVDDAGLRTVVK